MHQLLSSKTSTGTIVAYRNGAASTLCRTTRRHRLGVIRLLLKEGTGPGASSTRNMAPLVLTTGPVSRARKSMRTIGHLATRRPHVVTTLLRRNTGPRLRGNRDARTTSCTLINAHDGRLFRTGTRGGWGSFVRETCRGTIFFSRRCLLRRT